MDSRVECATCMKLFQSESTLKIHNESVHMVRCIICGMMLSNQEELLLHNKAVHEVSCELCPKTCTTLDELKLHYLIKHQIGASLESSGNKTRPGLESQQPIDSSSNEALGLENVCPQCKQVLQTPFDLVAHYRSKHLYQCSICRADFQNSKDMEVHNANCYDYIQR